MLSMRRLLFVVLACLPLAAVAAACEDPNDGRHDGNSPGGSGQQTSDDVPLHEARLHLAKRLGIDALDIDLVSIRPAGFNGCLGVRTPDQACTEQFIGGYIAIFQVDDEQHRYHFGGDQYVWADPAKEIDDGLPVDDPMLAPDLNRALAAYAAKDLELRLDADDEPVVTSIIPVVFPNGCMGFVPAGMDVCDDALAEGAVVFLLGGDGSNYRYHVGRNGVIPTDFVDGEITFEPQAEVRVTQQRMREDLARRLNADIDEVGMLSYQIVTWPDGCLGVYHPDALCTTALVEGYLAFLEGPDGKEYRYHGRADGEFVAASFETGARIGDPVPEE